MNSWANSFFVECPKDTDPAKAGDHVAIELRAPVGVKPLAALGKAFKRCTCGAELMLRGQAIAEGAGGRK
jgi:hypothetical protein